MQTAALASVTDKLDDKQQLLADVDLALDQIAGKAYDLALVEVTAHAVQETQKADRSLIGNQVRNVQNDPKIKKRDQDMIISWLETCRSKLREGASIVLEKVRSVLGSPENRRAGMEKIKEAVRPSMRAMLHRLTEQTHGAARKQERDYDQNVR